MWKTILLATSVSGIVIRGPTAPLENVKVFDQYVFAKNVQPAFMRESELKHGRLAMIASVLLPVSEQMTDKLGIHFFKIIHSLLHPVLH